MNATLLHRHLTGGWSQVGLPGAERRPRPLAGPTQRKAEVYDPGDRYLGGTLETASVDTAVTLGRPAAARRGRVRVRMGEETEASNAPFLVRVGTTDLTRAKNEDRDLPSRPTVSQGAVTVDTTVQGTRVRYGKTGNPSPPPTRTTLQPGHTGLIRPGSTTQLVSTPAKGRLVDCPSPDPGRPGQRTGKTQRPGRTKTWPPAGNQMLFLTDNNQGPVGRPMGCT